MSVEDRFSEFTARNYAGQAKAFLNAYWDEVEGDAEKVWEHCQLFVELDYENGKEGSDLDEFNAHRFLERMGETKTIKELRNELRAIDMDFNRRMALLEYLLFKYSKGVEDFVNRPQDSNEEVERAAAAVEAAQARLEEATAALEASTAAAELAAAEAETARIAADHAADELAKSQAAAAHAAEEAEKATIAANHAAEEAAISAEKAAVAQAADDEMKAAEDEVKNALAEVHAKEEAYQAQIEDCIKRSEEGGVVTRNKAKAELEILRSEDPQPLRTAKITLEAAQRRAERARAPFQAAAEEARVQAEIAASAQAAADEAKQLADQAKQEADAAEALSAQAKQEADDAANAAENSRVAAEAAAAEAERTANEASDAFAEAQQQLEEAKANSAGTGQGNLWWMSREMEEIEKYLPKGKRRT